MAFRLTSNTNSQLDYGSSSSYNNVSWLQSRDAVNFAVNYSLALNPNGGNVGISTGAPQATLDVNGNVRLARSMTQAADAGITITAADFGKTITVNSASAQIVTLPSITAADIGATVTVVKLGAGRVTIQAAASTYIADSAAAGTIYNTAVSPAYAAITLRLATSTTWIPISGHSAWITTN